MSRALASPETHERPHNRVYRSIFREHNGPGPYECHECHEQMEELEVVHHLDENPWNNTPSNLVAMHHACHNREHHVGIVMSDESNQRRRETFQATLASMSTEERQAAYNQSHIHLGAKRRLETRRKIGEALRNQSKASCIQCRREIPPAWLDRHVQGGKCKPWQI